MERAKPVPPSHVGDPRRDHGARQEQLGNLGPSQRQAVRRLATRQRREQVGVLLRGVRGGGGRRAAEVVDGERRCRRHAVLCVVKVLLVQMGGRSTEVCARWGPGTWRRAGAEPAGAGRLSLSADVRRTPSSIRMARGGTNECAHDERRGHQTPNTAVTTTGAELRSCLLS